MILQDNIKLYHASYIAIENIDLTLCSDGKDFGKDLLSLLKEVEIKTAEEKLGIMDLRAELEGGVQCNIEIQLQPHQYENERILYYWADTYKRQLKNKNKKFGIE